jgi:demethylmenaquinone methyltransferase/2-methoxy-6-polyprenyl-1,4-benzoquinol methylase
MDAGRDQALIDYYSCRAREYDRIYERPERQADLGGLRDAVADWLRDRQVLELACGTGYWTDVIAPTARSVLATDASAEVLEVARARLGAATGVKFRAADAFDLGSVPGDFDAAVAGFWVSHLDRRELSAWLASLAARLGPGARVVLLDNRFVEGSSTALSRRDDDGNTFQVRRLESGAEHEVRKNFFEEAELRELLRPTAEDLHVRISDCYWAVRYSVAAP